MELGERVQRRKEEGATGVITEICGDGLVRVRWGYTDFHDVVSKESPANLKPAPDATPFMIDGKEILNG